MSTSRDPDSRHAHYARLIVDRSLDVQPGWQVLIRTTPLARPLLEEVVRRIARRGAYAVVRMGFGMWPIDDVWAAEAPDELLAELPEIERHACDTMDARITIEAPEDTRKESVLSPDRLTLTNTAERYFFRRTLSDEIPWVGCQYPTEGLAREAGMTLEAFTELLFGAVLADWDAEGERLRRYSQHFNGAEEVRIVGAGTDLTLSLTGRSGLVDDGRHNLPGGEFFFAPLEDSASGVISFSEYPAIYQGYEFTGIHLEFRDGVVVGASAEKNEDILHSILDRDEGARRIGELGVGCNRAITRFMRNALFDEKIDGSVHLALGHSYTVSGGTNVSSIHWDIVKDLHREGRIEVDGRVVQENGRWLI
jgi:aminopeptidase